MPSVRSRSAFTNTHFLTASRYVSKKSSKINSIDDLKGKSVVSTAGTTNIKQLTEANAARNLNVNIIPAKDHAEAFLMVETDRAVAFVMDDILLASLVAGSKAPDDYVISKDAFSKPEPYGIMLRKDDAAFKKVVDAATAALYTGGEGQKIYDKWFTQKVPPKGLNLNVPISSGAEERVRQAVGLAGSGFVQVAVDPHGEEAPLRRLEPEATVGPSLETRRRPFSCGDEGFDQMSGHFELQNGRTFA